MNHLGTPALLFLVFLGLYLSGRVFGPNDLDTKDQPKTVSYTVDLLENGTWAWPSDMKGRPATKPPLYNWLAAPAIAITGSYSTFLFKLPSVLAALGCLGVSWLFFRHLHATSLPESIPVLPLLWLSSFAWLANFTVYGLIYTARPDMLLCFFLFAGWALATLLMEESPILQRSRILWSSLLWLSLLAAILTKGTPAVLLVLYLPLFSLLRFRSLKPLWRTGLPIGLPLVLALAYFWFQSSWSSLPQGDKDYLVQVESSRITEGGLLKVLKDLYKMPQYFLVRFLPWSLVFLWLLFKVHRGRFLTLPWTPIYVWFLLVLVFFSIPTFKRDDYLLPIYPVCSLAVGYALWKLSPRIRTGLIALGALLIAGAVADDFFTKDHLIPRYADNSVRFAQSVRQTVPKDAVLVFHRSGYNNLQAFLGRNSPPSDSEVDALQSGDYLLQPAYLLTDLQAREHRRQGPDLMNYEKVPPVNGMNMELLQLSAPIAHLSGNRPGLMGLYRIGKPSAPATKP